MHPRVAAARDMARHVTIDRVTGWREFGRHDFTAVNSFALFAGYPRSGHSLVGSLVTAHPDAAVAHELDAFRHVRSRLDRRALFGLLMARDQQFARTGSRSEAYQYAVPGQWQGRYRSLTVIGDKKGGGTSLLLGRHFELLGRLERTVGLPVKFVVVTRHPLDNVARMAVRGTQDLEHAAAVYLRMCATIERLVAEADCLVVRHEEFVEQPVGELGRITAWLGLVHDEAYLRSCAGIVNTSARLARDEVTWTSSVLNRLRREVSGMRALQGYTL